MPWGLAAGAALSIGGDIFNSNTASNASNQATQAEVNAANQAMGIQQQYLSPYANAGSQSLSALMSALGLGAGGGKPNLAAFQNSPGYQFQMQQGTNAINNSAAARGGIGGGNTLKALQGYGQGLADQTFQQYLGNLSGVTNMGAGAAGSLASSLSGDVQSIGNANAANSLAQGNISQNMMNGIMGSLNGSGNSSSTLNQLISRLTSGGGAPNGGSNDFMSQLMGLA